MSDLGTLGGNYSRGTDINDAGDVVGLSLVSPTNDSTRAFLWHNGSMSNLGTLPSPTGLDYRAYGINNAGQVVGHAYTLGVYDYAFIWEDGQMRRFGALGIGYSIAYDINNSGAVVGEANLSDYSPYSRAFICDNGVVTSLGALGGFYSAANAVNDCAQVVGWACDPNNDVRAFIWSEGVMADLGTLGGTSTANDINNLGQVVGQAIIPGGAHHAFLWQDGRMTDLNDLLPAESGWVLTVAQGINDRGWIVGSGSYLGGVEEHGFLMIPEPATLALLALGGAAMLRRRK